MTIVRLIFILAIVTIVGFAGASYWLFSSVNTPREHLRSNDFIRIEKGTTPRGIVTMLAKEGIIDSEIAASTYLRSFGDASKWQAGEFQFASPISTVEVFKQLEKGEDRTIRITFPEGFNRFDIAIRIVERLPLESMVEEKQVLELMNDTEMIRDIAPQARNLEGYMYPSTYNVPREAKPADVIRLMVEQFKKIWKPEWDTAAKAAGRTPHEIVTIASLIETESPVESERPIIAGVINNRLSKNMALGIDQTVVYVAKVESRWDGTIHKSDIEADSPYNTRKYRGIPPGPISSVTESSINAALNPSPNNYIFYVLNVEKNDGSHHFYASAAEFEKGKAEYQRWLKKQRMEKKANEENTRHN